MVLEGYDGFCEINGYTHHYLEGILRKGGVVNEDRINCVVVLWMLEYGLELLMHTMCVSSNSMLQSNNRETFRFPRSLYNCETLETLKLRAWVLVDVPSQACLKSLRTLHLRYVDYKDHSSFPNLLSGFKSLNCCLIENAPELVEANIDNVSKITNEKLLVSLTLAKRLSLALSPLELLACWHLEICNRILN
ncbi:hypothetical protein YC2023_105036 [Brassica napus]